MSDLSRREEPTFLRVARDDLGFQALVKGAVSMQTYFFVFLAISAVAAFIVIRNAQIDDKQRRLKAKGKRI